MYVYIFTNLLSHFTFNNFNVIIIVYKNIFFFNDTLYSD